MRIRLINPPALSEVKNNGQSTNTIVFTAEVDDVATLVHVPRDIITHRWPEDSDIVAVTKGHRIEIESAIQDNASRNNFFNLLEQPHAYLYNGVL